MTASEMVGRLSDLYVMYRQKYVLALPGGTMVTRDSKLTDKVMYGHVSCKYAVGVFAGPRSTKFICFDVDEHDEEKVHRLVDAMEASGIDRSKIYVSSSGGKGFHVEVFFDCWVYNTVAENYYRLIIDRCGFDKHKVEFRPTRSQSIKIPLSVHPKTGNRCWYMDRETLECIVDEDYILSIERFSADSFNDIVYRMNKEKWYADKATADGEVEINNGKKTYSNNFDYMPRLTRLGERHALMLKMGAVKRLQGIPQEQIFEELMQWYELQDKSFIDSSPAEVKADAIGISRWVWSDKFTPTQNARVRGKRDGEKGERRNDTPVAVTVDDVARVLAAETKNERRVMMLAAIYCRRYGVMILSMEQVGEIIGCTFMTVHRAVKALEDRRLMKHKSGGMKFVNGKKLMKANRYTVDVDDDTEGYVVEEAVTKDNFDEIYFGALAALCSDEELAASLTKAELKECRQRRKDDNNEEHEGIGGRTVGGEAEV